MQSLVHFSKNDLPQVKQTWRRVGVTKATVKQVLNNSRTSCSVPTGVGEAGLDEFVQQLVGDGVAGLVVSGHPEQRLPLPDPVLQHLRRSLHEVPLHMSPAEHGVVRLQTPDTTGHNQTNQDTTNQDTPSV